MEDGSRFFSKDVWKGIVVALIVVGAGQALLAWQYYRLEEKRLPQIEKELALQREEQEQSKAKEALSAFLHARQEGNKELATSYLTENAALEKEQGVFSLERATQGHTIVRLEKMGAGEFRAQVEIEIPEQIFPQIEIVRLLKILDFYFIDSLEIAG